MIEKKLSVRIMQMRLTQLFGALVLAAASSGVASVAIAQTAPLNSVPLPTSPDQPDSFVTPVAPADVPTSPRTLGIEAPYYGEPIAGESNRLLTLDEAFVQAFFRESGDFYANRQLPGQFKYIFGPGIPGRAGFPDLEIERDAQRINRVYQAALEQQNSSDPVLRTPDLPNPYDTSILRLPTSRRFVGPTEGFLGPVEGGEYRFETPLPR